MPDRLKRRTSAPKTGIVHLGPGAFFRAFHAMYTADAMAARGGDWGITAVSLKSRTARDQLTPQDGAFTAVELGPAGRRTRTVESIVRVLVAPEDPQAVVAAMADPAVRIVSLTITEKGYCHDPATGRLNRNNPEIAHDLVDPDHPQSALGFIVQALAQRRATGIRPFTVLTCDNLPSNGRLARGVILEFARDRDATLAEWIADNVPFPATMVDRITPATTLADIEALAASEGYYDPACVMHEPFRQWVIEDNFADGRPAWEVSGVQFVRDVEAHETMKLRCLNGTHSTLAYLGYLAGYQTIAETVSDVAFERLCKKLWREEIVPTVPRPEGEDLAAYCAALLVRYGNPGIRHRTWQIAMDGSQKLPQRLLATIRERIAQGQIPHGLCLGVAAWMRYVGGIDDSGAPIDVRDPLADRLRKASDSSDTVEGKVMALLHIRQVFDVELAANPTFRKAVMDAYIAIADKGSRAAVAAYAS